MTTSKAEQPAQSPAVTALPRGEPRGENARRGGTLRRTYRPSHGGRAGGRDRRCDGDRTAFATLCVEYTRGFRVCQEKNSQNVNFFLCAAAAAVRRAAGAKAPPLPQPHEYSSPPRDPHRPGPAPARPSRLHYAPLDSFLFFSILYSPLLSLESKKFSEFFQLFHDFSTLSTGSSTDHPQCYPHPAQAMRSLHRLTARLRSIFRHCSEFFR